MQRINDRLENIKLLVNQKLDSMLGEEKRINMMHEEKGLDGNALRNDLENLLKENKNYYDYNYSFETKLTQGGLERILKNKAVYDNDNNKFIISKSTPKIKTSCFDCKNKVTPVDNNNNSHKKAKLNCDQIAKNENLSTNVDKYKKSNPKILITFRNENETKLNQLNERGKNILHNKQNFLLTKELSNLRCKLNKMNNKNKQLKNILQEQNEVKNCHLLDRIINGFIEKLAINWNEISEMIIEELIEQEIFVLNEIELEKIEKEVRNPKGIDKTLPVKEKDEDANYFCRESLQEINKIFATCKSQEDQILSKYN